MKNKATFTKKDFVVVLCCVVFVLMNMGIIAPGGRQRAKEAVCLSNLLKWGSVFQMYTQDNDGYFDPDWYGEPALSPGWPGIMEPYYGDKRLRFCPMATKTYSQGAPVKFVCWPMLKDPSDPLSGWVPGGSYGRNTWASNPPAWVGNGHFWRTPNVSGADNIPLILDCQWAGGLPKDTDEPPPYDGYVSFGDEMNRFCISRHRGAINGCFVDLSVRKIGLKELWTLKWHKQFDTQGPWTEAGGCQPEDWPEWMRDL